LDNALNQGRITIFDMHIYGVDFTSTPTRSKPLVCAQAELDGDQLHLYDLQEWWDFTGLEAFLASGGSWAAGFDFPFGFPRRFLEAVGWPTHWEVYAARLAAFQSTNQAYRKLLRTLYKEWIKAYRERQPPGSKHLLRATDRLAGSISPLMVFGVPVGLMLMEGAPRLLASGASVIPCRPSEVQRIALEAYPALVVANLCSVRLPYKHESRPTARQQAARGQILEALSGEACRRTYGLQVKLADPVDLACRSDPAGDHLDAVLCTVQAAWSWHRRKQGWGIPPGCDTAEGWIVDPTLASYLPLTA
jgi:hypothetical protein